MTGKDNKNLNFTERPHILVVDDDDRISSLLFRFLSEEGFIVATAANTDEARTLLKKFAFDVMVVDVMMPGETGIEFTHSLQGKNDTPILLLTALGEGEDRIKGLESGADDYLTKPFEPRELVLRINAILRRTAKPNAKTLAPFRIGTLTYTPGENTLTGGNAPIILTDAEITLIENLAQAHGNIIKKEDLAEQCGVDPDSRTIDVQITRLRRKIEPDTKNPKYLRTVRGQGYFLKTETA